MLEREMSLVTETSALLYLFSGVCSVCSVCSGVSIHIAWIWQSAETPTPMGIEHANKWIHCRLLGASEHLHAFRAEVAVEGQVRDSWKRAIFARSSYKVPLADEGQNEYSVGQWDCRNMQGLLSCPCVVYGHVFINHNMDAHEDTFRLTKVHKQRLHTEVKTEVRASF